MTIETINTNLDNETNIDWIDNGEQASAAVLNRPLQQVSTIINNNFQFLEQNSLVTGSFGLGEKSIQATNNNVDEVFRSGFYHGFGSAHPNTPTNGDNPYPTHGGAFDLLTIGGSFGLDSYASQIAIKNTTSSPELSFRTIAGVSEGWQPWYSVWHSGNDGPGSGLNADLLDGLHASSFALKSDPELEKYITFNDYDDGSAANTGLRTYVRDGTWYVNNDVSASNTINISLGGNTVWHAGNLVKTASATDATEGKVPTYRAAGGIFGLGSTNYTDNDLSENNALNTYTRFFLSEGSTATGWDAGTLDSYPMGFNFFRSSVVKSQMAMGWAASGTGTLAFRTSDGSGNFTKAWNKVWHSGNDGSGSGLDADKLDGLHENTFMRRTANSNLDMGTYNLVHRNPNNTNSVADIGWENNYLRYRFGGSGETLGVRFDDYDSPRISLNRDGTIVNTGYTESAGFVGKGGTGLYLTAPGGGTYKNTSSSETGYIKITLPQSWTSTMMKFRVSVFDYDDNESFDVIISGYNTTSSDGYWTRTSATVISDNSVNRNFNVRFGHDGTKCAVYIGESNTTWGYPQIAVTEFHGGYANFSADQWNDGWEISITTTLGTISTTQAGTELGRYIDNSTVWHAGNDGPGSGLNADLLDGLDGSSYVKTFLAGNTGVTELGRYIDFHTTGSTADFDIRLDCESSTRLNVIGGGNDGLEVNGQKVWNAGNDGPGTGLNADLLDGLDSSSFLRSDTSDTFSRSSGILSFHNTPGDIINTSTGSRPALNVYQQTTGKDAFMQFHVASDYAAYFGLSGAENDFFVGGYSMGANKYRVYHEGNRSTLGVQTRKVIYRNSAETLTLNKSNMGSNGLLQLYAGGAGSNVSVDTSTFDPGSTITIKINNEGTIFRLKNLDDRIYLPDATSVAANVEVTVSKACTIELEKPTGSNWLMLQIH